MPATACQDVDGRRWHGSGTPTPLLLQQTTDTQQGATIAMMWGSRVLQQHPDALAGSTHHLGAAWLVVKKGRGLGRAEALQPPANCQTLSRFVCLFVRATNGLQTKVVSIYVWFLQLWSVGSITACVGNYCRSAPPFNKSAAIGETITLHSVLSSFTAAGQLQTPCAAQLRPTQSADTPPPAPCARTNRRAEAKQNSHACGNAGQQVHGHTSVFLVGPHHVGTQSVTKTPDSPAPSLNDPPLNKRDQPTDTSRPSCTPKQACITSTKEP